MNNPTRDELLTALAALAGRYPHWRLGQLMTNVAGWADADIWDVDDNQLLAAARKHLTTLAEPSPDETADLRRGA